jgi:hypothetical protein
MEKIAVRITSEEVSKLVQEEFFRRGIPWIGIGKKYDPGMFINSNDRYFAESVLYPGFIGIDGHQWWLDHKYKLIEASEFLGKPVEVAKSKEVLPEIKPCYCGKIPALAPETVCGKAAWAIKCECGRMSAYILKELCIEAWNRFVLVPPLKTDTEHCQHCGAYIGVEVHSAKCPNRMIPYTGPSVFEIKKHKESRIFYDDLASHGRPIPKRILGANAKRLKSSEEVGEE